MDAAASAYAPALLLDCRLCYLSFNTAEEKRQHAKSEWHVYQIRCRVAEPGTVIPPPDNLNGPKTSHGRPKQACTSGSSSPQAGDESYDEGSESDTSSEDKDMVEFVAEECLFCSHTSKDFDENISHMRQTHGLVVPSQASLMVDVRTLIWFLHMVIFSYRECICCGKRRRTVEAVRQHMTRVGHCRFDVTEEMSEFYDLQSLSLGQQAAVERSPSAYSQPDDRSTLRLPSGKLLAHRSHADPTPNSRHQREKSPADQSALPVEPSEPSHGAAGHAQALARRGRKEQALTAEIGRLRTGDRTGLVHLPESQQRSLLVARKKELDGAKRVERRKRGRLDNVGNKTTVHTKYYKQEVPVYMGG